MERNNIGFSICVICFNFSSKSNDFTSIQYQQNHKKLQIHLAIIRLDRITIMIWKSYSKSHPEQIMMIETDRQNSTTTCFPYFARPPNESTSYQKFELCFQGFVINGNHFYCNILLPLHGKNANCNITARWKHLINYCCIK